MDLTRLTQFGFWEGYIRLGGEEISIFPDRTPGTRDRSWGVRPVGEPEGGAPGLPPQFFWLWAPMHFDQRCTHCGLQRGRRGPAVARERQHRPRGPPRRARAGGDGDRRPPRALAAGHAPRARRARSRSRRTGARRSWSRSSRSSPSRCAASDTSIPSGDTGMWKGPEVIDGVTWTLADLDPMDPRHLHVQQLCRARIWRRGGARRPRAAGDRSARTVGVLLDPRSRAVSATPPPTITSRVVSRAGEGPSSAKATAGSSAMPITTWSMPRGRACS